MKVAFFSARPYDIAYFENIRSLHEFTFIEESLERDTIHLANQYQALCISATDVVDETILRLLVPLKIRLIVVRSSGIDNVDLNCADKKGIAVRWLPGYSPQAIAEHAVSLLLTLNRKTHLAFGRIKKGDFSIAGLEGFNLYRKTVGIIGMGRVGHAFATIMKGFGCRVLATDINMNADIPSDGVHYVSVTELASNSDIISLHCSLNESTHAIINREMLKVIKPGVMLINTARGQLVDTEAVLEALEDGRLGSYGADVYEHEKDFFYHTFKAPGEIGDPLLKKLMQQPNVLLTSHQAFFTREAMEQITRTVINELTYFENLTNEANQLLIV